jgi:hypothetical protein
VGGGQVLSWVPIFARHRRDKVGSIETAADFFKQRATHRKGAGLTRFFINAPDVPEVGNETESSRRHLPATAQATVSLSYRTKTAKSKAKRSKSTTLKNTVQKAKRA